VTYFQQHSDLRSYRYCFLSNKKRCILADTLKDTVHFSYLSQEVGFLLIDYVYERCAIDYNIDSNC
jgi:hypothetical protein